MKEINLGFYYHYKHDPKGAINNYAYEVIGIGNHTEADCRFADKYMVIYRPIYEAYVYKNGKMFDIRPYDMFTESIEKNGNIIPRFAKIANPEIIKQLISIRDIMYSNE